MRKQQKVEQEKVNPAKPKQPRNEPKFILATIVAVCPHRGKKCVMQGKSEIENNGFESTKVHRCCQGRRKDYKGCTFEYITEKEAQNYDRGFGLDIMNTIQNIILYLNPVITGTNTDTEEVVLMSTTQDMKARGFIPSKVRAIVNKDKLYKGWKFTKIDYSPEAVLTDA